MPRWKHIDTTGLEPKFDCADLVEQGFTKQQIIEWMTPRIKPGPAPAHVEAVKQKRKKVKKAKPKPAASPPPEPKSEEDGNVTRLKKPQADEILGVPPEFSEDGLADRFAEKYCEKLLYCGAWKTWLEWDDIVWNRDDTLVAFDYSRRIARKAARTISQRESLGDKRFRMADAISTFRTIGNVEKIARTDRRHVVIPSEFDSDPWALNTPAGMINLRTGQIRPTRKEDYASKITAVAPNNKVPEIWLNYLKEATQGDDELEAYLKRVAGYCLTGSIAEHAFFFCYGTGGNGKGIFKDILDWVLNSYATVANIDTFIESHYTRHSSEIAYFQGARLVTSTEPGEGARWSEGRIKAMTGGDPITAAYKHRNEFTFLPLFKLLFTGNFKPQLRSVDEAIKRRLYLIPFEHKVTEEKKDFFLDKKIREPEVAGGILHWMIEGCLEWQQTMLKPPKRVIYATSEYLESEDRIGRFIEDHCDALKSGRVKTALLFNLYKTWTAENNEYMVSNKRFKGLLRQKGYTNEKRGGESVILGLSLRSGWNNQE